jgi:D-Tyr-tRNAtyr deacylase
VFNDENSKISLSLLETGGSALVVSQFPSCDSAATDQLY